MQSNGVVLARLQQPVQRLGAATKVVFAVRLEPADGGPLGDDRSVMLGAQADAGARRQTIDQALDGESPRRARLYAVVHAPPRLGESLHGLFLASSLLG